MEDLRELILQTIKDAPLDGEVKRVLGDIKEDEVYGALTAVSMRIFGLSKVQCLAASIAIEKIGQEMKKEADVMMLCITAMTRRFLEEQNKNKLNLN